MGAANRAPARWLPEAGRLRPRKETPLLAACVQAGTGELTALQAPSGSSEQRENAPAGPHQLWLFLNEVIYFLEWSWPRA